MKSIHFTVLLIFSVASLAGVAVFDLWGDKELDYADAYQTIMMAIITGAVGTFRGKTDDDTPPPPPSNNTMPPSGP